MAKAAREMPGRGFVLSHTPAVLAKLRAEDAARRREVDAWAESLNRSVPTSALSQADKNAVWRHVKAEHPEQRAFLEDPEIQRLIRDRGAVPVFPPELVLAARREANKGGQP